QRHSRAPPRGPPGQSLSLERDASPGEASALLGASFFWPASLRSATPWIGRVTTPSTSARAQSTNGWGSVSSFWSEFPGTRRFGTQRRLDNLRSIACYLQRRNWRGCSNIVFGGQQARTKPSPRICARDHNRRCRCYSDLRSFV